MLMAHFLYKLYPPRPTFPDDMTEAEGKVMQEHIAYWKDLLQKKIVVIFGPVMDPKGIYGIGVLEVADENAVRNISGNDPAIKSKIGFRSEYFLMPDAIMR